MSLPHRQNLGKAPKEQPSPRCLHGDRRAYAHPFFKPQTARQYARTTREAPSQPIPAPALNEGKIFIKNS